MDYLAIIKDIGPIPIIASAVVVVAFLKALGFGNKKNSGGGSNSTSNGESEKRS